MKVCLVGSSGGHLTHLYMLKPFWKDKERLPEKGTAQRPGRFGNRSAAGCELGEAGVYHAVYERSVQNTELLCRD